MGSMNYNCVRSWHKMDYVFQTGMRKLSSLSQPAVIRIPVKMAEKIREYEKKKKTYLRDKRLKQSQQGNKMAPIIVCKRKEFNHYTGQSYSKFKEMPIASKGWGHRKSAGDYFTINNIGQNPAFTRIEEDVSNFDSLGLSETILKQIEKMGFEKPTNIQNLAIPHLLEEKNAIVAAETGNGKTLAFVAPMLQQVAKHKKSFHKDFPFNSPLGLIITPGRELAEQIHSVASTLASELGISVKLLKGGRTKVKMMYPRVNEVDLLVASFGALSKLTTTGIYKTNLVRHITIDEADTLFDDSFNEQMTHFLSKFPIQGARMEDNNQPLVMSGCQLVLVSATMPRSLHTILDPVVEFDSLEKISTPYLHRMMPHVKQSFYRVNHRTKKEKLLELIKKDKDKGTPVIVFSNYKKTCDWLTFLLNQNGISCINLSGQMPAALRKTHFEAFQSGQYQVLSCTDITSRGLDTITAGHIINYEFPNFIADYIHRCGRTGRVGSSISGMVSNLVHRPQEVQLTQKIEDSARRTIEFHNVNANIKRLINVAIEKEETKI